jgi:hypothetical protein
LTGAIVYRVYALNSVGVAISLTLATIGFFLIYKLYKKEKPENSQEPNQTVFSAVFSLFRISYVLVMAWLFYILLSHTTIDSIISPWEKIPKLFFVLYFFATLLLLALAYVSKKSMTLLISLHCLLSFSIALIIYKIGYGFDPFVHRATLGLIDKVGLVEPKPFYYLGQYSLVIIIHKLSQIPIETIDKLLVPLLTAIYLPGTLVQTLDKMFADKKISRITAIASLILPFAFFIISTPQNFAYLLLLLVALRGLACKNHYDLIFLYLLSATAILTQPIAGIPALIFTFVISIYHSDYKKGKKYFYALTFFCLTIALPVAFFFLNKNNSADAAGDISDNAAKLFSGLSFALPNQENIFLNFLYLYGLNIKFIILGLAIVGALIAWKNKDECRIFSLYLTGAVSIFASYILASLLPFSFLISYERSDYADRMLNVAAIFLLPFIILSIFSFLIRLNEQNKFIKYSLILCLTSLITASLYFSYPRLDRYHNSHGYSVGQNDVEAVKWIENDSGGNDYIVLANQQTSAAALYQYGFKKYYHDDIFYYPVPTGGKLYPYYLKMVYEAPERKTINEAMDLAGVNKAYFVLNKYWWASTKIAAEAKLTADSWQDFNNSEVLVFKFTK